MPQADTITFNELPFYQLAEPYPTPEEAETNTGIPLDSIFRPCDAPDTVYRRTLFTGHKLSPQHSGLQERPQLTAPGWVFVSLVLICALLRFYFSSHKLKLSELTKNTVENGSPDKAIRGQIQGVAFLPIVVLLTSALGTTIWFMAMRQTGIVGYLLLVLALTAAYLLRNGALGGLAAVFDQEQAMSAYITGNYVYHLLLTIVLTPMLFALVYIPGIATGMTIAIGSVTALTFLIRLIRGIKLFLTNSKTFSLFLFYYLCIVEIVPYLIALRWIISQ